MITSLGISKSKTVGEAFTKNCKTTKHKLVLGIKNGSKKMGENWFGKSPWNDIRWSVTLADKLHKPVKKLTKRRHVMASGPDDKWSAN